MRLFGPQSSGEVEKADYYCSATDLYRVEHMTSERALLEDCRTEALIDVPLSYLAKLRPVRSQAASCSSGSKR